MATKNLKVLMSGDTKPYRAEVDRAAVATTQFQKTAGDSMNDLAAVFGVNIESIKQQLTAMSSGFTTMLTSMKASAVGASVFKGAMNVIKIALISTGIGAIVVAFGALIAYFTQTERGAEIVERAMAGIKAVFKVLIDRAAAFGEGLYLIFSGEYKTGWETLKSSIQGVGAEMRDEATAASELTRRFQTLEDAEKTLELVNSERRANARELFAQAKEQETTAANKRKYILEAMALEKLAFSDEKTLAKEKLDIHSKQVQMGEARDEQNYKTLQLQGAINNLARDAANTEMTYSKALKGANKEIIANAEAITKQIEAQRKADGEGFDVGLKMKNPTLTAKVTTVTDDKMFTDNIAKSQKQSDAAYRKANANMSETKSVYMDLSATVTSGLGDMAGGIGEALGAFMMGEGSIKSFGTVVAGVFADMAITVGKMAIQIGLTTLAIQLGLKSVNPWIMIAAGVALVALGTAVKSGMAKVASGGSAGAIGSGGAQNYNYDTRGSTAAAAGQKITVEVSGKLTADGKGLSTALSNENTRVALST